MTNTWKIEMTDEIVDGDRKGVMIFYKDLKRTGVTTTFWVTSDEIPKIKDVFPGNERTGVYDNMRSTPAWLVAFGGVRWNDDYSDAWIKFTERSVEQMGLCP